MAMEAEVRAAAKVIAASPLIDAPKLGPNEWMGLARSILEAAEGERIKFMEGLFGPDVVSGDFVDRSDGPMSPGPMSDFFARKARDPWG